MNKYIVSVIIALVVGVGFGFYLDKGEQFGGTVHSTQERFPQGIRAGTSDQFTLSSVGGITTSGGFTTTGALTGTTFASGSVGSSSSSPAALGSAASGHFIIATSGSTGNASSTAVTANSTIIIQREGTTPIAGTTCNTAATTTPIVTSKIAGNGFIVTSAASPVTNPICLAYWIIN